MSRSLEDQAVLVMTGVDGRGRVGWVCAHKGRDEGRSSRLVLPWRTTVQLVCGCSSGCSGNHEQGGWMATGREHCGPGSQHVSCSRAEGKCRSKGKAHAAGWLPHLSLRKHCLELLPGDMSAPDRKRGWQALFSKPKARLPDRIWIEWLALRVPHLIGLKEKKCYFSSPKTTKRNGETKILFRLNKLQGDSLGRFQRVR